MLHSNKKRKVARIVMYWYLRRSEWIQDHSINLPPSLLMRISYLPCTPTAVWPNLRAPFRTPQRWGRGWVGFSWAHTQPSSFFWRYLLTWFCSDRYHTFLCKIKNTSSGASTVTYWDRMTTSFICRCNRRTETCRTNICFWILHCPLFIYYLVFLYFFINIINYFNFYLSFYFMV